jgi:ELP3 family radical SAM enzyme/protein acetyltransferase
MPNLPFTTPEKDRNMLINRLLGNKTEVKIEQKEDISWEYHDIAEPSLSADQWKLYPCETTAYTEIEKWYREGSYVPYAEEDLSKLLYDTMLNMYPWIRVNRIIRDISKGYIIASSNQPNTGQTILDLLKKNGDKCMCIRFREVKEKKWDGTYQLVVRQYQASEGTEYFISAESEDKQTIYGFTRLRLCKPAVEIFPELEGCALIRELHVYSNMNPVGEDINTVQHKGIGKKLLGTAEKIAQDNGYESMAIIAGVGVQRYYEKLGYFNDSEGKGDFMIKHF